MVTDGPRAEMHYPASPPPPDDPDATLGWLRDRMLIADLYDRYAYGVDSLDMDLVRSVFHPDCIIVGTMEQGRLDDYLEGIEAGLRAYHATMHFKGNQYIALEGDRAKVETWVVGYHMEAAGSPLQHLHLGLRYYDDVARFGAEWKITRREARLQWHTGPFPRPALGEPPYPRPPNCSRA